MHQKNLNLNRIKSYHKGEKEKEKVKERWLTFKFSKTTLKFPICVSCNRSVAASTNGLKALCIFIGMPIVFTSLFISTMLIDRSVYFAQNHWIYPTNDFDVYFFLLLSIVVLVYFQILKFDVVFCINFYYYCCCFCYYFRNTIDLFFI